MEEILDRKLICSRLIAVLPSKKLRRLQITNSRCVVYRLPRKLTNIFQNRVRAFSPRGHYVNNVPLSSLGKFVISFCWEARRERFGLQVLKLHLLDCTFGSRQVYLGRETKFDFILCGRFSVQINYSYSFLLLLT